MRRISMNVRLPIFSRLDPRQVREPERLEQPVMRDLERPVQLIELKLEDIGVWV